MAWHGLTKVVPVVTREVALPYEMERKPLFVCSPKMRKIADFSVFVASDNGEVIGRPMPDTYVALTNEEFWSVCQDALAGTGAVIESAGTFQSRARRFLTIRLGTADKVEIGGRTFLNRISLLDSVDGTTYFHAVNTSVCVVCANTARMALADAKGEFRFKLKHTKSLHAKIENMEAQVEAMLGVQADFNAALAMAHEHPMSSADARPLFAGWLGEGASSLSTRAVNTVERLEQLARGGGGNRGETLLDAISAVTDFYSHESSGGEAKPGFQWKQHLSSEYGSGARAKVDFIRSVFTLDDKGHATGVATDRIRETSRRGMDLLADYAKSN